MEFLTKLIDKLEELDKTIDDLAYELNISVHYLLNCVIDDDLSISMIRDISKLLNCNASDLLGF
jgi:hypothetical protein